MTGSTFPRLHTWADEEDVTAEDLNGEFNNILNNLNPQGLGGYEANTTQMKAQTSPGGIGTEVLATSGAGEIERLRFVLARLIGGPNNLWYDLPALSIAQVSTLLSSAVSIPANRIVSGAVASASSGQPIFLQPDGTLATVRLKAAATPFSVYIDNINYTATADVSLAGLSLAATSNNTAVVNDARLVSQSESLYAGEQDSPYPELNITSVGSNITALVGSFAAFKVAGEYFLAYVNTPTQLTRALRGYYFNSVNAPTVRTALSNGATITLCKLIWVFYNNAGALTVSYNNPIIASAQPTGPNPGDYWFDLIASKWMTFNGSIFVDAHATLIGMAVTDSTGCVAARSFNPFTFYDDINTLSLSIKDYATVQSDRGLSKVSVAGNMLDLSNTVPTWSMPADLDTGLSELAGTWYYFYVSLHGKLIISPERPYKRDDMLGLYHPYNLWRSIGSFYNDGSSNLIYLPVNNRPTALLGEIARSLSSGTFATISTTPNGITNLNISLTTKGRPVLITVNGDGASISGFIQIPGSEGARISLTRNGGLITSQSAIMPAITTESIPVGLSFVDNPPAGTHNYVLALNSIFGAAAVVIEGAVLSAYELN